MKEKFYRRYLSILSDEFPDFLIPYTHLNELTRLKDVGQFCGCDYSNIYSPVIFYSRFDHSLATSLMTWHFTHDKTQTIAALLHDIGTPCFSHCIDYLLGDYQKQEKSEKKLYDIIINSPILLSLLEKDGIDVSIFKDLSQFPVVENEKPKLCVDRLDGVLHTVLIWLHTRNFQEIKEVYNNITVISHNGKEELGFKDKKYADMFFSMIYEYSIELQSNEDKYVMQYIADCLKLLIENGVLSFEQLYTDKERDIVNIMQNSISSFSNFQEAFSIERSEEIPSIYNISFATKKRHVIPLCLQDGKAYRLNEISTFCQLLLNQYLEFKDSTYAFVNSVDEIKPKDNKKKQLNF